MYGIENMRGTYDSRAIVGRPSFASNRLHRPWRGEFDGQRNYEAKLN